MIRASSRALLFCAAALFAIPSVAWAQGAPAKDQPSGGSQGAKKRKYPYLFSGPGLHYSGVKLKGGGEPPPAPRPPGAGLQYITWPGFRTDVDAPTEVFIQLTGAVSYKVKERGQRVVVTLDKVAVYKRNTLRAVITRHFPGPVSWFKLRRAGRHRYKLDIRLRRAVKPTVQIKQQDKYTYLVVEFPAVRE